MPRASFCQPLKVLHIHGRMVRGGAEMRALDMLRHADRDRFEFHFCAVSGLVGELDAEITSLGGQVHRIRQSRLGFPGKFRALLRRNRFDVVHSHLHIYSGDLLRLAAASNVPVRIAHLHAPYANRSTTPGKRLLHGLLGLGFRRYASKTTMTRWMRRYATHILGVSDWTLRRVLGPDYASDPRCQVIYDGVAPASCDMSADLVGVRREFGITDDAPLCIHAGRMTAVKNHVRLVTIFAELLRHRPTARLLLVGRPVASQTDNQVEHQVRRRIAELSMDGRNIEDRILFVGERADVPRLLKAADLLIFPSISEGLGDVVLEAAAAGTPTLASDLPSIREIAARLDGVHLLSLDASNTHWAAKADALLNRRPGISSRRAASEAFVKSPFTIGHALPLLAAIWRSGEERSGGNGPTANSSDIKSGALADG